jgi:thiol:disulfide interchange protein DsbD
MKLRRIQLWICLCLCFGSAAQAPIQPVQWTAALAPKKAINPAMNIVIELSADVQEGWHVYGLTQLPGGPTPLRVTLDTNDVVEVAGTPTGTPPAKRYDTAFDLDTEVYEGSFALHLPVQINQHFAARRKLIPVSVRFQTCNDRVCLPPRTVHISVPIEISQTN